jgi:hypothetical protein
MISIWPLMLVIKSSDMSYMWLADASHRIACRLTQLMGDNANPGLVVRLIHLLSCVEIHSVSEFARWGRPLIWDVLRLVCFACD